MDRVPVRTTSHPLEQRSSISVEETLADLIGKTYELNHEDFLLIGDGFRGNIHREDICTREPLAFAILYLGFLIALPVGIAVILFNTIDKSMDEDTEGPSASYIFLFIARQFVGLAVAIILQSLTKIAVRGIDTWLSKRKFSSFDLLPSLLPVVGSTLSLFITQAFGRPLILFFWSLFSKRWVSGPQPSAHHWLHGQDRLEIFNASNPSGNLVENELYLNILNVALFLSILIFVKRSVVRVYLYRQAFLSYGLKLIQVMKKTIMVRDLLKLSDFYNKSRRNHWYIQTMPTRHLKGEQIINVPYRIPVTPEGIKQAIQFVYKDFTVTDQRHEDSSMCTLWLFRRAMELMKVAPWLEPAEEVYSDAHGMQREPGGKDFVNFFETVAYLAVDHEGYLVESQVRELVSVFQPDRNGCIPERDFVRIIRVIYRERQSLREMIHWIAHTHRQFEQLINVVFYVAVVITIPFFLKFDHKDLLLPMGAIIATCTFVIGSACSDYTKGCLFILMRLPYSIGDFIQINPSENVPFSKENICRVTEITLFNTKAVGLSDNVEKSLSNGSHYGDQILNWSQHPPKFQIVLEFPGNTKDALLICKNFQMKVQEYIEAHPRAWHPKNVTSLYSRRVEDKDEYRFEIEHRCLWLELDHILECKEQLFNYCQNVDVADVRAPDSSSTFQIYVR
ncbi:hypothetical protein FisN_3Hu019 [Fistulifera solaris]|uniref:EF-hand domain-containing protein n=1 Tax=Fistulifera solaris TaxID=1519565 RepID=A0A1Z5KTN6_FISSO|nr:hypothetical protein FisN_3Hu019 [Fistulifera solaris]|eukprot:GAX29502.1 hypothetical protein FisN_3Hu019 [Fistulifera solaris]